MPKKNVKGGAKARKKKKVTDTVCLKSTMKVDFKKIGRAHV